MLLKAVIYYLHLRFATLTLQQLAFKTRQRTWLHNVLAVKKMVNTSVLWWNTKYKFRLNNLFRKRAFPIFIIFHLYEGVGTPGDGTTIGKCPSSHSSYRCLSSGACNVCGLISGTHEGCVSTSTTPVCDADSTTSTIEDTAVEKLGVCKGCTKSGLNLVII